MTTPKLTPRMVPDPHETDATLYAALEKELLRAEKNGTIPNPDVGKIQVMENAPTRIGGLAFVRSRKPHHEMAAERFKSLYEGLYGAGNPASDPARVPVDTSPVAHDSGMADRLDRADELRRIMFVLGKAKLDLLVAVIVLGHSCGDLAERSSERARMEVVRRLLAVLDEIAALLGFVSRAA